MAGHTHPEVTRETFYAGLNGTTKAELNIMLAVFPNSILLFSLLHLSFSLATKRVWLQFCWEFLMVILPVVLALTTLCDAVWLLVATQLTISSYLLMRLVFSPAHPTKRPTPWRDIPVTSGRQFLTDLRVFVNVATTVSILAVDFQVFPRRFAKTETYGTGLMDAGVGLFMIGNALVSPEARGKASLQQRSLSSCLGRILKTVTSCSPLLILGFLRLLTVKSVDYHEHVSEYGVHWNFFFTLAAVRIVVAVVFTLIPVSLSAVMSVALAATYHHLLNMHGFEEYILHGSDGEGSRDGFIEANREGIFSCIGYSAIYLAGVSLGSFLFQQRSSMGEWFRCFVQLVLFNIVLLLLPLVLPQTAGPISRRLANLPYVLWVVTYCINNLLAYLAVDLCTTYIAAGSTRQGPLVPHGPTRRGLNGSSTDGNPRPSEAQRTDSTGDLPYSLLISAINRNQLFNFLLANLLTGAINLSMDTIHASSVVGFAVIVAYTFILCLVMVVMYTKNIKTKFW